MHGPSTVSGLGAYQSYFGHYDHTVASTDINAATFALLETLPLHPGNDK